MFETWREKTPTNLSPQVQRTQKTDPLETSVQGEDTQTFTVFLAADALNHVTEILFKSPTDKSVSRYYQPIIVQSQCMISIYYLLSDRITFLR